MLFSFQFIKLYFLQYDSQVIGNANFIENNNLELITHLFKYYNTEEEYWFGESFIISCNVNIVINISNALIGYNEKAVIVGRNKNIINRATEIYGMINWFTIGNESFHKDYAHFLFQYEKLQILTEKI